jgi:hypothetical protein
MKKIKADTVLLKKYERRLSAERAINQTCPFFEFKWE